MRESFGGQSQTTYKYLGPRQEPNNANYHVIECIGGEWGMTKIEPIDGGIRLSILGDWEATEFAYFLYHLEEIKYFDIELNEIGDMWVKEPRQCITQAFKNFIRGLFPPRKTMNYQGMVMKKHGRLYFALCPFHKEKIPSFSVRFDFGQNVNRGIYHCFGCGAGGDLEDFKLPTHDASEEFRKFEIGEVPF